MKSIISSQNLYDGLGIISSLVIKWEQFRRIHIPQIQQELVT